MKNVPVSTSRTKASSAQLSQRPVTTSKNSPAALVALAVFHVFIQAEVERGIGVGCGHQVPARAAAAQMIERRKPARHVIRLFERGGRRRNQSDVLRHRSNRREQGKRLERGRRVASPQRLRRHVEHGEMIGHEKRIETAAFERLREPLGIGAKLKLASGNAPG